MKRIVLVLFFYAAVFSFAEAKPKKNCYSIIDALLIANRAACQNIDQADLEKWDCDRDGKITIIDALKIAQILVRVEDGWTSDLPRSLKIIISRYSGRMNPEYVITNQNHIQHIYKLINYASNQTGPKNLLINTSVVPMYSGIFIEEKNQDIAGFTTKFKIYNGFFEDLKAPIYSGRPINKRYFKDKNRELEKFFLSLSNENIKIE